MNIPCGKPILVLALTAIITGCLIASRPASRARADLLLWTFVDTHVASYEKSIPDFTRRSGKTVDCHLVNPNAISLRLNAAFDRDLANDSSQPDVVEIEIGSIGRLFRPPTKDVGLLPLNELLSRSGGRSRYVETRLTPWTKEGVIFGVPHDVHPVTITFRKDLFDEAGVDLAGTTSWPVFQEKCLAFQRYWTARGFPNRHALELPSTASDYLLVMLQQRRISPIDDHNVVHLADANVAATIAFYAQLLAGPRRIAADASPGANVWINDIERGDLCAMLTPDWRAGMLRDAAGDQLRGKVAMMPLPRFDPTDAPTGSWGGTCSSIPRRCPNPQAAWNLIMALDSSREGVEARWRDTMTLPALQAMWDAPIFHQPDAFFSNQFCGELFIDLAKQLPPRHATPYATLASASLSNVLIKAGTRVRGGAVLNNLLISEVQAWLDDAAAELKRSIDFGTFPADSVQY